MKLLAQTRLVLGHDLKVNPALQDWSRGRSTAGGLKAPFLHFFIFFFYSNSMLFNKPNLLISV